MDRRPMQYLGPLWIPTQILDRGVVEWVGVALNLCLVVSKMEFWGLVMDGTGLCSKSGGLPEWGGWSPGSWSVNRVRCLYLRRRQMGWLDDLRSQVEMVRNHKVRGVDSWILIWSQLG